MKIKSILLKIIMTLFLNFAIAGVVSGQALIFLYFFGDELASEELYLSTEGGLNLSGISGLEKGSISLGANFGLGFNIKLNDRWQLVPQFRPLSLNGANSIDPIIDVPSEFNISQTDLNLNHIDVPVMFRYNFSKVLFVSAGPQISFLTMAKQESNGSYANDSETLLKLDVKGYINKVNYSFPVEMGYWFRLPDKNSIRNTKMSFYLRYCPGINYVYKDTEAYGKSRISNLQVGVSFATIEK